jgi:3-(3-hydroxy-phenyl)propionate hydroxylase
VVLPGTSGAGGRFVQPVLTDGRKLDDLTGGEWRLFVRDDAVPGSAAGVTRIAASTLPDNGAVTAWLDAHGADAVLIRPDHYVFGSASHSAEDLLAARAAQLFSHQELAA